MIVLFNEDDFQESPQFLFSFNSKELRTFETALQAINKLLNAETVKYQDEKEALQELEERLKKADFIINCKENLCRIVKEKLESEKIAFLYYGIDEIGFIQE